MAINKSIKISQLSGISEVTSNDALLISRPTGSDIPQNNSTGVYASYKIDALSLCKQISAMTYIPLNERMNDYTSATNKTIDKYYYDIVSAFNTLSDNLCTDISVLSVNLSNTVSSLCSDLSTDFDNLSDGLCSNFESLSNGLCTTFDFLSNSLCTIMSTWWTNQLNNLRYDLCNYISSNYVSLASKQTITGQKTFIEDIIGTCLSAKWAK